MRALRRIRGWSGDAQFTLVAAVALIVGSMAPWFEYRPDTAFPGDYTYGVETNAGALCLLAGVLAVRLLNRSVGPRAAAESGALAAIALLAGGLVFVSLVNHWSDPVSPRWGMWLTGLAALAMLVGSFTMLGESDDSPTPG